MSASRPSSLAAALAHPSRTSLPRGAASSAACPRASGLRLRAAASARRCARRRASFSFRLSANRKGRAEGRAEGGAEGGAGEGNSGAAKVRKPVCCRAQPVAVRCKQVAENSLAGKPCPPTPTCDAREHGGGHPRAARQPGAQRARQRSLHILTQLLLIVGTHKLGCLARHAGHAGAAPRGRGQGGQHGGQAGALGSGLDLALYRQRGEGSQGRGGQGRRRGKGEELIRSTGR